MAGTKSVDSGEDQRQEASGNEETIRRPWWQSELLRRRRVSEKFPKFCSCLYIARPCRCDRVEQLGGTEMPNCVQLQQLGETEKFKSVTPRLKTQINLMISVGPKWRNRSDRESQRGFGSLSLCESGTRSAPHTKWFESDLIKFCDVAWIEFEMRKA